MNDRLKQYDNLESLLYQIDGADFQDTFEEMQKYLQNAEKIIDDKVKQVESKMQNMSDQLKRTAGVYIFNKKKRLKEEEYLQIERNKLMERIQEHKVNLKIGFHPITMALRQKKNDIIRLNQTKEIIEDFNKIMNGNQEEMMKYLSLDEKNFNNSALKIYVFKSLLQEMTSSNYDTARNFIKKKFIDLKTKIISNFKQGYLKKDIIIINNTLPFCQQYELMQQISDYYNIEAFKQTHKLTKVQPQAINSQIKNFYFLLKRGFTYAFSSNMTTGERNFYKISSVLSKHIQFFSRRLITHVYQKIIKQTVDSVLKSLPNSTDYLLALELFYIECRNMLKQDQCLVDDQKIFHLMQTYIESIFDIYHQNYINKEIYSLTMIYEENIGIIIEQIKAIDALQEEVTTKKEIPKFSFKKMLDYKIQAKKTYNTQYIRAKLQALSNLFMDPALQKLFQSTKYALNRNNKISKINEIDKNRNEILSLFIKQIGQLLNNIIISLKDIVPSFQDNAPPLEHQFFQIIPQINVVLQRMEFLYSQYKKQTNYQLSQSIKLEQRKEDLIIQCQKNLNKIVGDALACILSLQKSVLRERSAYKSNYNESISQKLYTILERYIKSINRINQFTYRQSLLKTFGLQFINVLIQHYSTITYSKQFLGSMYVDISGFGRIIKLINIQMVEQRQKVFKSLIDIYIIKNDEKSINDYIKTQKQTVLAGQKDEMILAYTKNKQRNEKN